MLFWLLLASIVKASDIAMTLYSNESSLLNAKAKPKTDEDEIHFLLYCRHNLKQYKEIKVNDEESLLKSNYNFNVSSKIIIPGWISTSKTTRAIETLKDALLNKTEFNIIVVDWNKLANGQYKSANGFASTVTAFLIEFITFLISNGVSTEKLHLIGHSIGAHIAGITGKHLRTHFNVLIDAITGLDPAYPQYKFCTEDQRLQKYDARHVEVIHTNGGFWGYRSSLGHIDFFPNGGRWQPGCNHDKRELCAHDRAVWYYAYSILGVKFVSVKVEYADTIRYNTKKTLAMGGLDLKYGLTGNYWLRTGHTAPFKFNPDDDTK